MPVSPVVHESLKQVLDWNNSRATQAKSWAAAIYFLIGLGMICQTFTLVLLHTWWAPQRWLRFLPKHRDMRLATAYWFYPALATNFILTAGGGMPGWMSINFLFTVWIIWCLGRGMWIRHVTVADKSYLKPTVQAEWSHLPEALGRRQHHLVIASAFLMLLSFALVMVLVYAFDLKEYRLVERNPVVPISEFQPAMTAKTIQLMYAWQGLATDMRLAIYVQILTNWCGRNFKEKISDKEIIKKDWITKYQINMSWYVIEDYNKFESINDWFVRTIKTSQRPTAELANDDVVVSPADCRMLVYYNVDASKVWIKGAKWNLNQLMDYLVIDGDADYFREGVMVVARLAPQDYHRFHSPVTGRVDYVGSKPGTYWSVNADAAQSENYPFYNMRQIMVIDTEGPMQKVGFVGIGATCVGSVVLQDGQGTPLVPGMRLKKGGEVGFMQFGGSTIILLFKKNTMILDCDLVLFSKYPVETYIPVGARVGQANPSGTMPIYIGTAEDHEELRSHRERAHLPTNPDGTVGSEPPPHSHAPSRADDGSSAATSLAPREGS